MKLNDLPDAEPFSHLPSRGDKIVFAACVLILVLWIVGVI